MITHENYCDMGDDCTCGAQAEIQDRASKILDLPRSVAIEVISGLLELAGMQVSPQLLLDDEANTATLRDKDTEVEYLPGYSNLAATVIAGMLSSRRGEVETL